MISRPRKIPFIRVTDFMRQSLERSGKAKEVTVYYFAALIPRIPFVDILRRTYSCL